MESAVTNSVTMLIKKVGAQPGWTVSDSSSSGPDSNSRGGKRPSTGGEAAPGLRKTMDSRALLSNVRRSPTLPSRSSVHVGQQMLRTWSNWNLLFYIPLRGIAAAGGKDPAHGWLKAMPSAVASQHNGLTSLPTMPP